MTDSDIIKTKQTFAFMFILQLIYVTVYITTNITTFRLQNQWQKEQIIALRADVEKLKSVTK